LPNGHIARLGLSENLKRLYIYGNLKDKIKSSFIVSILAKILDIKKLQ